MKEKEQVSREHKTQALLMANLESMKNSLELKESREKRLLETNMAAARKESISLKKKIENDSEQYKTSLQVIWDSEIWLPFLSKNIS